MSSLIDDSPDGLNTPEFSVSELSGAVKRIVEGEFGHVRVRGEVGRVSRPRSGHVYLDLKDDRAVLAGVIWKGVASGLVMQPEEGMEVVATGRLTTFPGQSRYQIVIEEIAPAGIGALMAMLEKRRKVLAAEGLFDETRKRMTPFLPQVVGVVTSPSGAVIRDILHRFSERFPVHVLVWPVAVQGEKCAPEVARAINGFSALPADGPIPRPDVVIVARGGGSVEDLWGFNEEIVVRAAAASEIPLISAVGHETDTTLIDHAADRRAPTPTAAAEMAVPVRGELAAMVADLQARRLRVMGSSLDRRKQRLTDLSRALPRPDQILAERRQRLDLAAARLPAPAAMLSDRRQRLDIAQSKLPTPARLLDASRHALVQISTRIAPALRQQTHQARLTLTEHAAGLTLAPLMQRLAHLREQLMTRAAQITPAIRRSRETATERLWGLGRTLQTLSYQRTIARGYAVLRNEAGRVISASADAPTGSKLDIQLSDGHLAARVNGPASSTSTRVQSRPKTKPKNSGNDGQGSLF
ncbi:MAG: exodeoxyribonuclease VII large subunit [Pseudomonadota bacterium]